MKTMSNSKIYISLSVILCISLGFSVFFLVHSLFFPKQKTNEPTSEWVYIYLSQEEDDSSKETDEAQSVGWILKAYQERIGIFREDGSLEDILDVQIKTLPKADRDLLEEGIYAPDRITLESLIEDYSE